MTTSATPICFACGRYPAQVFSVRRHVGMLLLQRFVKLRQAMCRDHALEITKAFTLKTLWQGWWGYISFFVNWFVLGSNALILMRASRMSPPSALQPMPGPVTGTG